MKVRIISAFVVAIVACKNGSGSPPPDAKPAGPTVPQLPPQIPRLPSCSHCLNGEAACVPERGLWRCTGGAQSFCLPPPTYPTCP